MGIIGTYVNNKHLRQPEAWYALHTTLISVGWVSQGEGNGVTGGMGTTGIVTSGSFVWSVLKHPSSSRQVILSTEGLGTIGYSYDGSLSGGSATSYPRSGYYSVTNSPFYESGSPFYTIISVQDVEPYSFIAQSIRYSSGIRHLGSVLFTYLDEVQPHDVDPYLISKGGGFSSFDQAFYGASQLGRCLRPGSTTKYMSVQGQRIGYQTDQQGIWPRYAPLTHSDGYHQALDRVMWGHQSFNNPLLKDGYKGISSYFVAVPTFINLPSTNMASYNDERYLYGGPYGFIIPWDQGPFPWS